jgi:hypothetical protein
LSLAGCSDDEASDGAEPQQLQHPELTETQLKQLMDTLRDIRAMGPGAANTGGTEQAALRNGFASQVEYERVRTHVALALLRVNLGVEGGFGDIGQRTRIEDRIRELEAELRADEKNVELAAADRNLRAAAIRAQIAELRDQMEHDADLAGAVESQLAGIPSETLDLVNRYREDLMVLFAPVLVPESPLTGAPEDR